MWLVYDAKREHPIALKRLLIASAAQMLRFKREFRALEPLMHPNLVRLYEIGEDEEGLFFSMELVDGSAFAPYIYGGPLQVATEVEIPATVASDDVTPSPVLKADGNRTRTDVQTADGQTPSVSPSQTTAPGQLPASVTLGAIQTSSSPREKHSLEGTPTATSAPTAQLRAGGGRAVGASTPRSLTARRAIDPSELPYVDEARLRECLVQLLDGLSFLHERGLIHRDLKPDNLRVASDGTLKILDFGIVSMLSRTQEDIGLTMGTVGYMPPEQLMGEAVSPASDLYALGAILFRLYTGVPVFEGSFDLQKRKHLDEEAPDIRTLREDVPADMAALIGDLLKKAPDSRPSAEEIRARLGLRRAAVHRGRLSDGANIERREISERLVEHLERAREGRFTAASLVGPSGVGKSHLAERLIERARRADVPTLIARARPNDYLPFAGIDGALDDLAALLRRSESTAEVTSHQQKASVLFPTLRPHGLQHPPRCSHAAALAAVVELLALVARRYGGLLLLVDDVQWTSADAERLIQAIAQAAPPHLFVLATSRPSDGQAPIDDVFVDKIEVPHLDHDAMKTLLRGLEQSRTAHTSLPPLSEASVEHLATVCDGRPALAELLVEAMTEASDLHDQQLSMERLWSQITSDLNPLESLLLSLSSLSERALPAQVAAACAGTTAAILEDAALVLQRKRLLTVFGKESTLRIAVPHDLIRGMTQTRLSAEETRATHFRLAQTLERTNSGAAGDLAHHYFAAESFEDGVRWAREGARLATEQFAYRVAADLHGLIAEHAENDARVDALQNRANCLDAAGEYDGALRSYRDAMPLTRSSEVRAAIHHGMAACLFNLNRFEPATHELSQALRAEGRQLPGAVRSLWAAVRFVSGPGRVRPPSHRAREDQGPSVNFSQHVLAATSISYYKPLVGIALMQQAGERAARAEDWAGAAWVDYVMAYHAQFAEQRARVSVLSQKYQDRAAIFASRMETPDWRIEVMPLFLAGVNAKRLGQWQAAADYLDRALTFYEREETENNFSHLFGLVHRAQVEGFQGNLAEMIRYTKRLRAAASLSGDSAIQVHVEFLEGAARFYQGDFEDPLRSLRSERFSMHSVAGSLARMAVHVQCLYVEPSATPLESLQKGLRDAREFRILHSMYGGEIAAIVAQAHYAARLAGERPNSRLLKKMARIASIAPPFMTLPAQRVQAYTAELEGDATRSHALLIAAADRAQALGLPLDEAIARYQIAVRLGDGDHGHREASEQTMARLGVSPALLLEDPRSR